MRGTNVNIRIVATANDVTMTIDQGVDRVDPVKVANDVGALMDASRSVGRAEMAVEVAVDAEDRARKDARNERRRNARKAAKKTPTRGKGSSHSPRAARRRR